MTRRLTEMALFRGIPQTIIVRWLRTTMATARVASSALVVAKVTLNSLYASQEDKGESHKMRSPFSDTGKILVPNHFMYPTGLLSTNICVSVRLSAFVSAALSIEARGTVASWAAEQKRPILPETYPASIQASFSTASR